MLLELLVALALLGIRIWEFFSDLQQHQVQGSKKGTIFMADFPGFWIFEISP